MERASRSAANGEFFIPSDWANNMPLNQARRFSVEVQRLRNTPQPLMENFAEQRAKARR